MATPFLKWAGGKARLFPAIVGALPPTFSRYHEPFLGGGAAFFGLAASRPISAPALNDANGDLIGAFAVVRDDVESLIEQLAAMSATYLPLTGAERAAYYYGLRAQDPASPVARAARFMFLNRTCYNGLYRVNRSGQFNVPHGRYVRPAIVNEANLRDVSALLQTATLTANDFEGACTATADGDLVYLDPPYHPLSATAKFTAYTREEFLWPEQLRLARLFEELTGRGVYAILSNSAHPAIAALYSGFERREVPMSRAINSNPAKRAPVPELLVSNVAEVRRRHG